MFHSRAGCVPIFAYEYLASTNNCIRGKILRRDEQQGAYADESLRAALNGKVRAEDAGLATEISLGVLRWQRLLDLLIDRNLTKIGKTLDIEVRVALRMGMYQLLFS